MILNSTSGLPSNVVTKVVEDEYGFAWIGTPSGLARYDGTTVEVFVHNDEDSSSISGNVIHDILPDPTTGRVWLTTEKGLSYFDRKNKIFVNYKYHPGHSNSVPDHQADRLLKDKDGRIWIGFREGGLLEYRPESDDFQQHICNTNTPSTNNIDCQRPIQDIQEDLVDDNLLWLATGNGIARFNKSTGDVEFFRVEGEEGDAINFANDPRQLFVHPNGKIYYGTWYQGVFVFDIKTKIITRLNPCYQNNTGPFVRDVINGFYQKSKDEFWINSRNGFQLYDIRTGCITASLKNEGKDWYSIEHIDSEGRIWSASTKDGFRIFNPLMQQFSILQFEPPGSKYPAIARKILEDTVRHQLIVVAQIARGLFILDQKTGTWECIPPPLDFDLDEKGGFQGWDGVFLENGEVLIVENEALYLYKPGAKRLEKYAVQPNIKNQAPRLRKIIKASDGYYWISGNLAGLLRLDTKKQVIQDFKKELTKTWNDKIGGDQLVEDQRGNIWLREHDGLLVYKKATGRFIYLRYNPEDLRAFRGGGVMDTDAKGRIWIATRREFLAYAHADSVEQGMLRLFGKKEGLLDEKVWSVKMYHGKLLVFTDKYIQVFNPESMQFENHFALGYGLGDYDSNTLLLSNEQMAVSKLGSIALFYPDSLKTNTERPRPYVASFNVFDKTWKLNNDLNHPDSVYLSYKQNFFSFELSAIGYNLPEQITYRYKLDGFEEEWQDGTKRRFAAYTNVPGGDYQFLVEAINNEGLSLGEPSVTYLHVSTVWYKKNWFWALLLFTLSGLGYLAYQYKIGQVRKEERLRSDYEGKLADVELSALRAQMNPHFIFNALNSIEYFIISNEPERASDYLNRFSRLIRLILQNSKNKTVPLKDDLEALRLYIEVESMRFDNLFDYEVKTEIGLDLENTFVPPMLLQPYVENAIWHGLMQKTGSKGKLDLIIHRNNGHLICLIEDNGIGREAAVQLKSKSATRRKSYGMKITSERLTMLNKVAGANASVQVYDLKDEKGIAVGTRVELAIPL
ncbi:MAG: histidine kinase [Saprospiraceae bacterium]